jgi:hypothetical protein
MSLITQEIVKLQQFTTNKRARSISRSESDDIQPEQTENNEQADNAADDFTIDSNSNLTKQLKKVKF